MNVISRRIHSTLAAWQQGRIGEVPPGWELPVGMWACPFGWVAYTCASAMLRPDSTPHEGIGMSGKFEVYKDKSGEFRFRLKAGNGEIIAVGESYKTKAAALGGVESVKKSAPEAAVVDLSE